MGNQLFLTVMDASKYIYYLGTPDLNLFLSSLFFGYLGALCLILMEVGARDTTTLYSPTHFSWSWFFKDNCVKILLDIILIAVAIRFLPQLFGTALDPFKSFIIGLGVDQLAAKAKTARDKLFPIDSGAANSITTVVQTDTKVSSVANVTTEPKVEAIAESESNLEQNQQNAS